MKKETKTASPFTFFMLNRDDFMNMSVQDISKDFTQKVKEYEEYIENMDLEALKAEEARIIPIMQEWDNKVKDIFYDLPATCVFNASKPVTVSRKTVGEYINKLLEKVECEFSYTLGYYELWQWWNEPKATISYNNLNTTLQVLGSGLKFRGPQQWSMILIINEYFKPLHEQYTRDIMFTHLYGTCHSRLLDAMNMKDPNKANNTESLPDGTVLMDGPVQ
jgi:hypothetical protein